MPCAPWMIAVLMPMTSPRGRQQSTGLAGIERPVVWITSSICRPVLERSDRPSAEILCRRFAPRNDVDEEPSGGPGNYCRGCALISKNGVSLMDSLQAILLLVMGTTVVMSLASIPWPLRPRGLRFSLLIRCRQTPHRELPETVIGQPPVLDLRRDSIQRMPQKCASRRAACQLLV
jgi:hypothetical protein